MCTTQPIKNTEKLKEFRNYYKYKIPRNYTLIILGLNTALRIGDILKLRWSDVSKNGEFLDHIRLMEEKTGKTNQILINNSAKEALRYYKSHLAKVNDDDYIFYSPKCPHEHLSRQQAFRIVKRAADSVGLDETISCHSLRKTFGYHAWKKGCPPVLLREMDIYITTHHMK